MTRGAMRPWLSVVGIGEDGLAGLAPAARGLIDTAEILFGGARHLALVPRGKARRIAWGGLAADLDRIGRLRGQRVCVLASGDPMWFGIGATLAKRFPVGAMTVLPHPGAFSLAAARLGWPLAEVACLSVHGRPLESVALHLHPGARLLVLAEDESTPARLAALLRDRGFGKSRITALERLGGPKEKVSDAQASRWHSRRCDPLTTLAIEAVAEDSSVARSRVPGLPEEAFVHDGQITQHEIRAAALAALAPWPGALLWDIGAGSGSVAIEWMRAGGRAIAIERVAARRDFIARNAAMLGVPGLAIVAGVAPAALKGLAAPDAIFVGGGTSNPALLAAAWRALPQGGRLVAHAVTTEGEAALTLFHVKHGGTLARLAVARLAAVGKFHCWHPQAPVTQYVGTRL
jgi:precorrin-6Y C5,15-methyltransferase (decarboxylating)